MNWRERGNPRGISRWLWVSADVAWEIGNTLQAFGSWLSFGPAAPVIDGPAYHELHLGFATRDEADADRVFGALSLVAAGCEEEGYCDRVTFGSMKRVEAEDDASELTAEAE